jgi:cytochrome bd-type quinol oxidase subunit 2
MKRPKIKIRKTAMDKSLEILTFLLIAGSALLIGVYYAELPEKLPIHFNWPSKDKNGLGTKDLLWASPIICGIIAIGLYKLNQYPWVFNYPTAINEKNAENHYRQATQMLRVLNLLIGFLCLSLTLISVLDGLKIENDLDQYIEPLLPVLFIGLPVLYVVKMLMNKKTAGKTE